MLPDRIERRLDKTGDCWLWTGCIQKPYRSNKGGYGLVGWEGKTVLLHRLVYTLLVGPIPEGRQIDHLCHVRHCCAPHHLEVVDGRTNQHRGLNTPAVRTTCPQGHDYDKENTYIVRGERHCRMCRREQSRRYEARRPKRDRRKVAT